MFFKLFTLNTNDDGALDEKELVSATRSEATSTRSHKLANLKIYLAVAVAMFATWAVSSSLPALVTTQSQGEGTVKIALMLVSYVVIAVTLSRYPAPALGSVGLIFLNAAFVVDLVSGVMHYLGDSTPIAQQSANLKPVLYNFKYHHLNPKSNVNDDNALLITSFVLLPVLSAVAFLCIRVLAPRFVARRRAVVVVMYWWAMLCWSVQCEIHKLVDTENLLAGTDGGCASPPVLEGGLSMQSSAAPLLACYLC